VTGLGDTSSFARPYVISWNLTYRCNLACEHCYLDAGSRPEVEAFADRSELSTDGCFGVIDEVASFAPDCLLILTGGEPLLRRDILEIVRYAAAKGLWVVVGTNGVKITDNLAKLLKHEGVRGLSLSLDALDEQQHDAFRRVRGAWRNTVEGAKILARAGLPFIVQTTVARHNVKELAAIADFAHGELGAKVWNSTRGTTIMCSSSSARFRSASRAACSSTPSARPTMHACWSPRTPSHRS
jgi:AdoMet-dependent heme synthase